MSTDNVFALACPNGRGALHLHRVSGPQSWDLCLPSLHFRTAYGFSPKAKKDITPRRAYHALFLDEKGSTLDDVVVTFYQGSSSFTGEDSLEITSHGNPLITVTLHSRLRGLGLSDAKPGEFTHRAFLNGKLDLCQAEAIAALIDAETMGGVKVARGATDERLAKRTQKLRASLIEVRAQLEAQIDFGEDDVGALPWEAVTAQCREVSQQLHTLELSFSRTQFLQRGLRTALVGPPNAGKSSLFNSLLRDDRVIVSAQAGTTRDVVKERLAIAQRDFVLADTAGVRSTEDTLEALGIARTQKEAELSDLVVIVLSAEEPLDSSSQLLRQILQRLPAAISVCVVLSKCDLSEEHRKLLAEPPLSREGNRRSAWVPLRKRLGVPEKALFVPCAQENVDHLQQALCGAYDELSQQSGEHSSSRDDSSGHLISQRQRDEVVRARKCVEQALKLCEQRAYPEMIASEIIACEQALEDLMGRIDVDEIFNNIFSSFCIGK